MDTIRINDKDYRVEVNWNVLSELCRIKGIDDVSAIDQVTKFSPEEIANLIYLCLKEGADMDGKELDLKLEDIGRYVRVKELNDFLLIFKKQVNPGYTESIKKKKRRRMFGRH